MGNGSGIEAIRLHTNDGKPRTGPCRIEDRESTGGSANWGILYPICHVIESRGNKERLCDRIEGVARETYCRSPGGVTNRLRQALRNANRYLYLRNRALGERQSLFASMSCLAIRGTDVYTCGAGAHAIFVISGGRVRSFASPMPASHLGLGRRWPDNGHVLGRNALLPEPRFSYGQVSPGDLVLAVAAGDAEAIEHGAEALEAVADEEELRLAAKNAGRLLGTCGDLSALLLRVPSYTAGLQGESRASGMRKVDRLASAGQGLHPFRRSERPVEMQQADGRLHWRSLLPSKTASMPGARKAVASRSGMESAARPSLPRGVVGRRKKQPNRNIAEHSLEMCRLAATFVVSLIAGLLSASAKLLRAGYKLAQQIGSWVRQHRVFQRLGRACKLGLVGIWSGSKGLLISILPDRQAPVGTYRRTYAAAAQPMARAKLVGFRVSGRTRLAIGAVILLILLVVVIVAGLRVNSRFKQADVETLVAQAEEAMALAEAEDTTAERVALLRDAKDLVEQATAIGVSDAGLSQLSERLGTQWDVTTGVVRTGFEASEISLLADQPPRRIVIHENKLYVLDASGQRISSYGLDQDGQLEKDQEPWTWQLQEEADDAAAERILDIESVSAAYGRLTPALLILTTEGRLLELNAVGVVREVSVSNHLRWESPQAIRTYYGSLYVLDSGRQNVIKYIPTGDDYEYPPVNYFQGSPDIQWDRVVDMAVDDIVYLVMSNGSVLRFADQEPQAFGQQGLYPPLQNPVAILAPDGSSSVFVAEPDQARIVEFSKGGQYIRQLRTTSDVEDPLKDLQAFEIETGHDHLLVGTHDAIYAAPLQSVE